jgi:3-dehydrosphinganine reductase
LILVASVSAFYGTPDFASYAATKAGVLSIAQALNMEWRESGIHVGVICPHFADTALYREAEDKVALARGNKLFVEVTTPEQVAAAMLRGMEKRQFMIWSSWRTRLVYWLSRYGDVFAPGLMMWQWMTAQRRARQN